MKHLRILLLIAIFFGAVRVRADDKSTSIEYGVKAVVLFNFAKYVRWPDATFTAPNQPIRVCMLGKSAVADTFNSSEAPTEAQGRPFTFQQLDAAKIKEEAPKCQILYVVNTEYSTLTPLLPDLQKAHVLTVTDEDSDNGIISFLIQNGKVRFRIRREAAEKAGLELGSQLLKLAIIED